MHKFFKLLCVGFLCVTTSYGQQSAIYTSDVSKYVSALSLYNNEQYLASQVLFQNVKDEVKDVTIQGDCAYYIADAAVRLGQKGADNLMLKFVEEYPSSTKRNSAFLNVAEYYFNNGDYSQARKWYERVDNKSLSSAALERYNFNNGYSYFKKKEFDKAKKHLDKVRGSKKYGAQAKYYLGFMAYEGDNYEEANELFEQAETEEESYKGELAYFKADLNFKSGKFQAAIDEGKSQLGSANAKEKSELNKIIGESYFNLKQYAEALPYLKNYKGKKGKWSNTDYYQLGYTYYKQGDYKSAINEFNRIIDGGNSVAQNAYYHLAESYLKTDRKQEAFNAFKNASEMDFDAKIKEDAGLNYVKLSYELGNAFTSVPEVITSYIKEYANSPAKQELEKLLIDSYITSKNYNEAIKLLEGAKSFENKVAYQKVTFYLGIERYNEGKYQDAKDFFKKSLNESHEELFTTRATYWLSESDYVLNNYNEAIIGYKQYMNSAEASTTPEYSELNYNLGYAYFSNKDYANAVSYFEKFVAQSKTEPTKQNDAYLRLGDSQFISSKYWPALEAYNKVIAAKGADSDYATFQKSMSYGFIKRIESKIEGLSGFSAKFPDSKFRDDVLYELGNVYVSQNNTEKAIAAYDELVRETPKSSYVSKTLLKKALIYDNGGQSDKSLSVLKKVAADFPGTPEASQAVTTAKFIYIDSGKVDEYGKWVSTLDFIDVEDTELDDASYTQAEQQYLANNTSQAQRLMSDYLKKYPTGLHTLQAHFYLGQLAFAKEDYAETIPHYEFVISKERSEFTEQALARLGQVHLTQKDYLEAIPVLKRLETEADFPQNIIFAQSNLMKSYYEQKDYEQAVKYAEKALSNTKIGNDVKSDAQVIIARSSIETGDEARAKTAYAAVKEIATGILAAEALYYDAYFKNKELDFTGSNVKVQELARDYSGYKELGAKGLVLMAKNFYGLEDAYQATYILESIISNFGEYPAIAQEADVLLSEIKAKEAKTNSSIEEGGN